MFDIYDYIILYMYMDLGDSCGKWWKFHTGAFGFMLHSIGWCCFKRPVRRKTRFFASRKIMDVVQIVFSRFPIDNRIISHHPFKKNNIPIVSPKILIFPTKNHGFVCFVSGEPRVGGSWRQAAHNRGECKPCGFLGHQSGRLGESSLFRGGKRIAQIIQYRKFKLVQALETL
jgi:hypothetical protein